MLAHDPMLPPEPTCEEARDRQARWTFFRVVFVFVYAGVILDVVTTALGYRKSGATYEQNPLGGALIGHLGWLGLMFLLTVLCLVCYNSVRVVHRTLGRRWILFINGFLVLVAAFRWLAVVTAVLYLAQPSS